MTTTLSTPTETGSDLKRIFNFSAGPATLPEQVIKQAQHDLWNIAGSGVGICEHSHRGKVFDQVLAEAEADCRKIANIGSDYSVLFLQGGASLQFAMIPMNFMGSDQTVDFLNTGEWTKKAIAEAKNFGNVNLAFDGSGTTFDHIPTASEINASSNPAYTHYCSNNTIYGTQFREVPNADSPLVCDASSDIYSKPIDVNKHAIIFAGAQKNLGPSGCALVIIKNEFMESATAKVPSILDYKKHADKGSRLNTPPAFAIYMIGQVFKWILNQGGLTAVAKNNEEKAAIVYDAIESSGGFYEAVAKPESRSLMNITLRTPNEDLDKKFISEAMDNDMSGLKGYRTIGGLRASIYNAFPKQGCVTLAQFMKDFAASNG